MDFFFAFHPKQAEDEVILDVRRAYSVEQQSHPDSREVAFVTDPHLSLVAMVIISSLSVMTSTLHI